MHFTCANRSIAHTKMTYSLLSRTVIGTKENNSLSSLCVVFVETIDIRESITIILVIRRVERVAHQQFVARNEYTPGVGVYMFSY